MVALTRTVVVVAILSGGSLCSAQDLACPSQPDTPISVVRVRLTFPLGEEPLESPSLYADIGDRSGVTLTPTPNDWVLDLPAAVPDVPPVMRFAALETFRPRRRGWQFTAPVVAVTAENGRCVARFSFAANRIWRIRVSADPQDPAVSVFCKTRQICDPGSKTVLVTRSLPIFEPIEITMKFADRRCWYDHTVTYNKNQTELLIPKSDIVTKMINLRRCDQFDYAGGVRVPSGVSIRLELPER